MKSIKDSMTRAAMTLLLAVMTTATAVAAQNTLVSHLDYCKAGVGSIYMAGWVYDSDPNTIRSWELGHGIEVITFVTTDPNETYDDYLPIPHETEYLVRDDVNKAYGLNGYHGFMAMVDFTPYVDLFLGDEGDLSERTFYVKIYGKFNPGTGSQYVVLHSTSVTVRPNFGDGSEDIPYQILDADDWNSIADVLADNDIGPFFSNRYYQLAKDEYPDDGYDEGYDNTTAVTKMWGTSACPFAGHFDGNGQTLNVALNGAMHVAPFAFTNGATIQNLIVGGTINASQYAGGIVGHGGSGSLTLQNCVCAATISGFANYAGGLMGWCDNLTLNLQNCLFKGSFSPGSGGKYHPIALKNAGATVAAPAAVGIYYVNNASPSAELNNNIIIGAEGFPVSTTKEDWKWDDPVTAVDGQTYYAVHFEGKDLPYEYAFENKNLDAEGWMMKDCLPETGIYKNGDDHHYFFCFPTYINSQPNTYYHYLISPEFNGRSSIRVSFDYHRDAGINDETDAIFQVGYSTTTNDIEAFAWDGPITVNSFRWIPCEKEYPKGTKFIAIKMHPTVCGIWLDNFIFSACSYPSPTHLSTIDITEDTASPSWEAPAADHLITGYAYQYKKASDAEWSLEMEVHTTFATITGLSADTDYEFRVKVLYGESGESSFVTTQFTTAKELPYECGFENGMDRWSMVDIAKDLFEQFTKICEEAKYDGANGFMFESYVYAPQYLISPRFAGTSELRVSFYFRDRKPDSGYYETFQVGYSTTTNDIDAFIWSKDIYATNLPWTKAVHTFPMGTRYIAVRYMSTYSVGLYLDNFSVEEKSDFEKPTNLTVSEVTNHSVTLAWAAPNEATGYAYQYQDVNDNVWSDEATVYDTSITLNNLPINTTFTFRLRALYSGYNASNYVSTKFTTEGDIETLPYVESFENGMKGWRVVNGHISTGIYSDYSVHDGKYGFCFDSNTNEFQYLISPQLDGNDAKMFTFYYRHYYDGTYNLPAQFLVGYSTTTKNLGEFSWKTYDTTADWSKLSFTCPEGTKYVAIARISGYWVYVDDITITTTNLPSMPQDLSVNDVTATTADISWTSNAETNRVRYRVKPLFFEDFEGGLGQWKVVRNGEGTANTDWSQWNLAEGTENWATGHSGDYVALSISYDYETDIVYNVDNWLISPQVSLNGTLKFWVQDSGNSHESFEVWVSTAADDINAFTKIGSGVSTNKWKEFSFDLSSYNGVSGYFAIRHQSEGNPFFAVDDVGIYLGDDEWASLTDTGNKIRVTGLQPGSNYEFQVRSEFYNYSTDWTDMAYFTTTDVIPLSDVSDNGQTIADMADGQTHKVMLQDRILYKDGSWNTLCLPFDVDLSAPDCPLAGGGLTVMALDGANSHFAGGTLTLNFTTVYDGNTHTGNITAGTPYIIKWTENTSTPIILAPVFNGVTVSDATANVETDFVDFLGNTSPFASTEGLLFDEHNPNNGACRAALRLANPGGADFDGWYTDAALTTPVTTIPFADDGTVTLYTRVTNPLVLGDVNGDGTVTPADAIMILYHYFNVEQNGFNAAAADMNGDSNITPADAIEALYKFFNSGQSHAPRKGQLEREPQ